MPMTEDRTVEDEQTIALMAAIIYAGLIQRNGADTAMESAAILVANRMFERLTHVEHQEP